MQLEHYPSRETTIELPSLALLTAPNDQRSIVGMGTVLRKVDGGRAIIGVLAFDQLYLIVDKKVVPFIPALSIRHESGTFMGKLSINAGATNLIQTRYWKARPAIVTALDPVYDQIDDTEQNFCSYLASCYEDPSWRKWVYERYQPASQYRNCEEHEAHEECINSPFLISSSNHCLPKIGLLGVQRDENPLRFPPAEGRKGGETLISDQSRISVQTSKEEQMQFNKPCIELLMSPQT